MTRLRLGSFCSGYGGLDLAVARVLDVEPAWFADPDPGAAAILAHHWPTVPNLGDITSVTWDDVTRVDIVTGGYPCQPFSVAGKRKGTSDARHLWPYIARALRVLRPRFAFFENVANHLRLGFDTVLADLAALGFDAEWVTVRASGVGAAHARRRLFVLAVANSPDLGHERSGEAWRRRPGPTYSRVSAPDSDGTGKPTQPRNVDSPCPREHAAVNLRCSSSAAADAQGSGSQGARPEPAGRRSERSGCAAADSDRDPVREQPIAVPGSGGLSVAELDGSEWGDYAPAVDRWARVIGRSAPAPTESGRDGRPRLSPVFVEWLMGLDEGHVTGVPGLSRNQMLTALGNGVVPQQGAAALAELLDRIRR